MSLEDIYDFQGNPRGGRAQMGTVFGRATGILTLDLQKLAKWKGATIVASGVFQTGSNLGVTYIGSWDFTSSIAGPHTLRFNEFYLQQGFLGGKVTVRAGQIAAQNEFDNQAIGFDDQGSAFKTWVNNSLCCNVPTTIQTYASFAPFGKPGIYIRTDPTKHIFLKLATFSSPHSFDVGDPSGTRFDFRNAPAEGSTLGYRLGTADSAHPGIFKIGQIHNFGYYESFVTHQKSHGNDELFVDVGQALWREHAGGRYTHQEIDLQFSFSAAPRRLNQNDAETVAGLRFVGMVRKRPSDIAGVGVVNSHFSRDWSRDLVATGQPSRASQTTLEAGYKFVIRPWISVWPDFQYIWKPSGDRRLGDTPVLALRLVFDH